LERGRAVQQLQGDMGGTVRGVTVMQSGVKTTPRQLSRVSPRWPRQEQVQDGRERLSPLVPNQPMNK
jgi:hypothetical protein